LAPLSEIIPKFFIGRYEKTLFYVSLIALELMHGLFFFFFTKIIINTFTTVKHIEKELIIIKKNVNVINFILTINRTLLYY